MSDKLPQVALAESDAPRRFIYRKVYDCLRNSVATAGEFAYTKGTVAAACAEALNDRFDALCASDSPP